jgi:hypothetical protein
MARYTIPDQVVTLTFEGTDFAGAEVTLRRGLPYRTVLELQLLGAVVSDNTIESMVALNELFVRKVLVRWNLADSDDVDIPCNVSGFEDLPMDFLGLIYTGWLEAMGMGGNTGTDTDTDSPLVNGRVDDLAAQAVTGG